MRIHRPLLLLIANLCLLGCIVTEPLRYEQVPDYGDAKIQDFISPNSIQCYFVYLGHLWNFTEKLSIHDADVITEQQAYAFSGLKVIAKVDGYEEFYQHNIFYHPKNSSIGIIPIPFKNVIISAKFGWENFSTTYTTTLQKAFSCKPGRAILAFASGKAERVEDPIGVKWLDKIFINEKDYMNYKYIDLSGEEKSLIYSYLKNKGNTTPNDFFLKMLSRGKSSL